MIKELAVLCIVFYQRVVSPALRALAGPAAGCRYYPSCSTYAIGALRQYGLWRGSVVSIRRVLRCNPLAAGGYDPLNQTPA